MNDRRRNRQAQAHPGEVESGERGVDRHGLRQRASARRADRVLAWVRTQHTTSELHGFLMKARGRPTEQDADHAVVDLERSCRFTPMSANYTVERTSHTSQRFGALVPDAILVQRLQQRYQQA